MKNPSNRVNGTPPFPLRFFHLDLRIQVMTATALHALAGQLAGSGFNGIILEWEATFPFKKHPVIPNRYAYTPAEIRSFLNHCRRLGLETIPMQQCFGHIEYILQHDRYAHLREDEKEISQLCPIKAAEAVPLFKDLFGELAAAHNSDYLFIGCDETYLLGKCTACGKKAAALGKSRLFVDYVREMCALTARLGKRPVIWADMLLAHPEAAQALPRDLVLVDWNYGWPPDRFGDPSKLIKTGLEFWGAPSLRSNPDNYYLVSWEKHLNNFRDFLPYCHDKRYQGVVLTSWSTSGIYGFEWDSFYEPVAMHPIRRVYPLRGFRILMQAFATAMESPEKFDPTAFVTEYAMKEFGFFLKEAGEFRRSLFADAFQVYKPRKDEYREPEAALASVRAAQKILRNLTPVRNRPEFNHFLLLADIREHYLEFKQIEKSVQSGSLNDARRKAAALKLEALLRRSDGIAKRFSGLMRGYLHPPEIAEENAFRKRKMELLCQRLTRSR
jgi:hexosaminidase